MFSEQLEHLAQVPGDFLAEQQSQHHGFEGGMRVGGENTEFEKNRALRPHHAPRAKQAW